MNIEDEENMTPERQAYWENLAEEASRQDAGSRPLRGVVSHPWTYARGHRIEWDGEQWVYADTRERYDDSRACIRCGRHPTPEGFDACLGHLPGVASACCGHGVEPGVIERCG